MKKADRSLAAAAGADGLERYQARISLDSDMGELFQWVMALRPGSRTRELINLIRVGFAQQHAAPLPATVKDGGNLPVTVPPPAGDVPVPSSVDEAMTRDMSALRDWNLTEMCRPPAAEQH
jgi:hypothetical protein